MSFQQIPTPQQHPPTQQQQPPALNGHVNHQNAESMAQMNNKMNSQNRPPPSTATAFNPNFQQQATNKMSALNQPTNKYPPPPGSQSQQQPLHQQQLPQQQHPPNFQPAAYLASQANRQMMLSNGNSATSSRTSSPGLQMNSNHLINNNSNINNNNHNNINNQFPSKNINSNINNNSNINHSGGAIPPSQLPPMQNNSNNNNLNNNMQYVPTAAQSLPHLPPQVSNSNNQLGSDIYKVNASKSMPGILNPSAPPATMQQQQQQQQQPQQQINKSIPNLTSNIQNLSLNNGAPPMRAVNGQNYNNSSANNLVNAMQRPSSAMPAAKVIPSNQLPPSSQLPTMPPTQAPHQQMQQPTMRMGPPPAAQGPLPPQQQQTQPQQQQGHLQQSQPQQQQQPALPQQNTQQQYLQQMSTQSTATATAFNKRPMYPSQTNNMQQPQQHQPQPNQQMQQPQQMQQNMYNGQVNPGLQPNQQFQQNQYNAGTMNSQFSNPASGATMGFNRMWGNETVDLLQNRHILPTEKVKPPPIKLNHHFHEAINCNPDIFRCSLTKIPESNNLLQKSRLPLGILIHPFRDLNNLPVISCSTIVRCRACRTYINPFVFFVDSKKWKCNLCYRVNELPEEFQYDPVTKTYGEPTRRPEIRSSTIEFIAPSEYMLRPPQPAIYLFLLDVSSIAQQSGYLNLVCNTLIEQLDNLPGDARTQVGVIAYNSAIHFYNIAEGFNQPHEVTILDVDDVFLPYPDNLLINLKACKELIKDLLNQLPKRFENEHDSHSALGAALQIAFKMMSASGGRVTVFQTCLPNHGPGALQSRENPNNRSSKDVQHLGPATDFYKRLALEFSGQQIAVDMFLINSQYSDLATLSGISKFSGGCIHHFPLLNLTKTQQIKTFKKCFERYLTRKIGFEAVMRVRCTRGLAIHTFHGNFFVRSTDLLSLPNVNPDAGFGMQLTYEESLSDIKTVCFQAALLYTSSKAERRIRVHTLCLPVVSSLSEVMYSADVQCIVGLLSKMAVDRSLTSNISDARDAFINATVDVFGAFKIAQNLPSGASGIVAPQNLGLLPLYILALLKHPAFRTGTSTRLDDRVYAMCEMKSLPIDQLMRYVYPDFYLLDCLFENNNNTDDSDNENKVEPPRLQLSAEKLDSRSMFLLDSGINIYIYIGSNVSPQLLKNIMNVNAVNEIPEACYDLPKTGTPSSEILHTFIDTLNEEKPFTSTLQIIRDTSQFRALFIEKFVDDRNENALSYYEFLQHLRTQVK